MSGRSHAEEGKSLKSRSGAQGQKGSSEQLWEDVHDAKIQRKEAGT